MAGRVGFKVTNQVVTPYDTDKFPIVDMVDVKGGYHTASSIEEMKAIPVKRRSEGMLVYITTTKELYRYERNQAGKLEFIELKLVTAADLEKLRLRKRIMETLRAKQEGDNQIFHLSNPVYCYKGTDEHSPIGFYINGIRYFENEDFYYDSNNNTISWKRYNATEGQETGIDATTRDAHIEYEI